MTLLLVMNLGFAWGASTPVVLQGGKYVARTKNVGGMKTRA